MRNNKTTFLPFVEDIEGEAETFLRKYCETVLNSPQATPIRDIAHNQMHLDIVDTEILSPDNSIQGAITFSAGIMQVYDLSSEEYADYEVIRPTVFIDAGIINQGRLNNTLAHECYHWYKHRAYFRHEDARESGSAFAFRSLTTGPIGQNQKWSNIDKMEWQARTIAPKILMPRSTVQMLIAERLGGVEGKDINASMLKNIAEEMAETYQVSRQSAAIRLADFGYPEAIELYESEVMFADHRRRKSPGAAKLHHQPIDVVAAFRLYTSDEHLKEALDTGAFCFAEGYFVLRDEKYVLHGGTSPVLTEYAKTHLSECALDFSYKWVHSSTSDREKQYLFRANAGLEPRYLRLPDIQDYPNNNEYDMALKNALKDTKANYKKWLDRSRDCTESTSQRMRKYMKMANWDSATFRNKTHLSEMTLSRLNGNQKLSVAAYTAIAVGLELSLSETEDALRLSGLGYDNSKNEDIAYRYILSAFYGCPIDECNEVLIEIGGIPLGAKEREPKEARKAR